MFPYQLSFIQDEIFKTHGSRLQVYKSRVYTEKQKVAFNFSFLISLFAFMPFECLPTTNFRLEFMLQLFTAFMVCFE